MPAGLPSDVGLSSIVFDGATVQYDNSSQSLDLEASLLTLCDEQFKPHSIEGPSRLEIHAKVAGGGLLQGGVPGDDLTLVGDVAIDGSDAPPVHGVLLTGEIVGMRRSGPTDSQWQLEFLPTGGQLLPYFAGQQILVTAETAECPGVASFTASFHSPVHGDLRPNVSRESTCDNPMALECGGCEARCGCGPVLDPCGTLPTERLSAPIDCISNGGVGSSLLASAGDPGGPVGDLTSYAGSGAGSVLGGGGGSAAPWNENTEYSSSPNDSSGAAPEPSTLIIWAGGVALVALAHRWKPADQRPGAIVTPQDLSWRKRSAKQ